LHPQALLDALERALPVLAGAPWLRPTDWHELDRRLSGLRRLLASTARHVSPVARDRLPGARPATLRPRRRCSDDARRADTANTGAASRLGPHRSSSREGDSLRIGEVTMEQPPKRRIYLCHACVTGYKLTNDGHHTRAIQHYLGHRNIQHTTRDTELAADRVKNFWQD
jgi:hypothetical protein